MKRVVIDPITRIEGHLKIEVTVDNGKVVDAKSTGTMFRGFEIILQGRDPRDALHLTQRACGVCSASHGMASALNIDNAFGVTPPDNGRILRNMVVGANFIHSHLLHFYHLAALDYVKGPEAMPFIPRYKGDYRLPEDVNAACVDHYIKALEMRRIAHEMRCMFAGKAPHHVGFVPGGINETPTVDKIAGYLWRLRQLQDFINNVYIPDVLAVADAYKDYKGLGAGHKNLLAYGVFDLDSKGTKKLLKRGAYTQGKDIPVDANKITEDVKYSRFKDETSGLNPKEGKTEPEARKRGAYSWMKAPRYEGLPHEVGPLARMWVNGDYREGISAIDRHAARALEAKKIAEALEGWVFELKPGEPVCAPSEVPKNGEGMGLTEAPRGALGHWIKISDSKIDLYQLVVPTTWNCSPRDDKGVRGAVEEALIGIPVADTENPIEVVRLVRSFDPCIACAAHLITPDGDLLNKIKVC